jgi:hypothetical protein
MGGLKRVDALKTMVDAYRTRTRNETKAYIAL